MFCMLFLAISTEWVRNHSIFGIQVQKIKITKIIEGNFVITAKKDIFKEMVATKIITMNNLIIVNRKKLL